MSKTENVRFSGILRGEGLEATCTVYALKVTLTNAPNVSSLTKYRITNVSKPLPNGTYRLFVHGESIDVRHENGNWLSSSG